MLPVSPILLAVFLLCLGAVFVFIEVLLPGFGFFGIGGILLILASGVITILAVPMGLLIVLGESLVLGFIMYTIYKYLKRKQLVGKIILDDVVGTEKREIGGLDYFMGKEGITKSALRPFGMVDFSGASLEVKSDSGYIPENSKVKVIEIEEDRLIVKSIDKLTN